MRPYILHVIDSLAPGGAERMAVEIANATEQTRFRVGLCVTRSNTTLACELHPDIPLYVLDRSARFDWKGFCKFRQVVNQQAVDLFHVHGRSTMAFLALCKSIHLVDQPVLFHDHFSIEINDSVPPWFRWWGSKYVAQYVGVYDKLAHWAQRAGIDASRIHIIGNALNLSRIFNAEPLDIRQECGIPIDTMLGVCIGSIRPQKGLELLFRALRELHCDIPFVILVIGGVGDQNYYQKCLRELEQLGRLDQVRLLGSRGDIPNILRGGVDFAVISSLSESGPLVLIEYMAAGLPFVATHVGNICQRAHDLGVPGFVPPGNPLALARALQQLLSLSPLERKERGEIGRHIALEHFDIRKHMPRWYQLYEKVLCEGKDS
jgi:glycosyltransferase involved in cell wall biosynthesis